MTRVLFISYFFPPTGGAPAQRSLKFARFLPQEGYLPIILTGPGTSHDQWTPHDPSLSKELPEGVPVFRVRTPVPGPRKKALRRAERWLNLSSTFARWWIDEATREGEAALASQGATLIYASMSPFESAPVAAALSRKHGIPWVADLRDAWAVDEIQTYPSAVHRKLAQREMHRLLSSAAVIIMNTPEAEVRLKEVFPDFERKSVVTITNGFDSEDFNDPVPAKNTGKFTIVHAGSFLTDSGLLHRKRRRFYEGLGGCDPGVDTATRSHLVLFEAIDRWMNADPSVKNHLEIVFAGNAPRSASPSDLEKRILALTRFEGYLPRHESLGIVRTADLLFLAMHNLPVGQRSTSAPSKIYEYMASGRPILAAVPDSDARDFMSQSGTASVCRPDDADAMVAILQSAYATWQAGKPLPRSNAEFLRRFERRTLTRTLAAQFATALASEGSFVR